MATLLSGQNQSFGRYAGNTQVLRASAVLTTGYVATANDIQCGAASKVLLLFNFTVGSSTGFTFKIEGSDDGGVTLYELSYEDTSTNPHTLRILENTVAGTSLRSYTFNNDFKLFRVSVKALTDATGTLLAVSGRGVYDPIPSYTL